MRREWLRFKDWVTWGKALSSAEIIASLFGGASSVLVSTALSSPGHYVISFFAVAAELGLIAACASV